MPRVVALPMMRRRRRTRRRSDIVVEVILINLLFMRRREKRGWAVMRIIYRVMFRLPRLMCVDMNLHVNLS